MEILESIYTRRSIREFTDTIVSDEEIQQIIEAGMRAPSSKNSCPWHFLILKGNEKDEVADWTEQNESGRSTMPLNLETNNAPENVSKEIIDSTKASAQVVRSASVLILVFNKAPYTVGKDVFVKNVNSGNVYTFVSEVLGLGACMQNMLLASHALGLGAVALADVCTAEQKIRHKYDIKYDFAIGVAIGHPAYNPGKRPIQPEKQLNKFNANLFDK